MQGPLDVIGASGAGALSENLREACLAALEIPRVQAREHALRFTWAASAGQFLRNVEAARAAFFAARARQSGRQPSSFFISASVKSRTFN